MKASELPDDWKIRPTEDGLLLMHLTEQGWKVVGGPYKKRIAAVRRFQRTQYWSPYAGEQPSGSN